MVGLFGRVLGLVAVAAAMPAVAATAPPRPRLIVAISVDQFSAALFDQYRSRFTGGLRVMADQGVVFANGYQSHAATETCPGHSTILTGRHPSATGIVANSWYDKASGAQAYCVYDPAGPVPGRDTEPRGPANLKVPTLGEWMKAANPASRVFAVSGKDRAAIMMAGHHADGTFWWDDELGFNTYVPAGTTPEQRLAPVAAFNQAVFAGWADKPPVWTPIDQRCLVDLGVRQYGSLAVDHEVPPAGWTLDPSKPYRDDKNFAKWFRASPGIDQVTLDLAAKLIDAEHLGQGSAPDLLAVSLSATDYVGHRYGNEGPEMCDNLAHLDRALGTFLTKLAALKVPVIVVLTADHGSIDAAERVAERGVPARRISADAMLGEVSGQLQEQFKLDYSPLAGDPSEISIALLSNDTPAMRQRVTAATIALLRKRPEVVAVYTKAQALAGLPPKGKPVDELTFLERIAESTDAERSGDIMAVLPAYATIGDPLKTGDVIAGHGSVWNYDRRVPILFWWPGAEGFEQPIPIETVDIAPTLAAEVGVKTPVVDGRCLDLDRSKASVCGR